MDKQNVKKDKEEAKPSADATKSGAKVQENSQKKSSGDIK